MKRTTKIFEEYIKKNRLFVTVAFACLIAGVCVGAAALVSMPEGQTAEIAQYLSGFLAISSQTPMANTQIFSSSIANMLQISLFLWLCGFTKLGIPVAPGIVGIRGFVCGFTIAALIRHYGSSGLLASAVGILPQMLILFPCLIVFSVAAMNQAQMWGLVSDRSERRRRFMQYTISCAFLMVITLLSVLIESYISPHLITWALNIK